MIEAVAAEFAARFGRPKAGSLEVAGNPGAGTALVAIGTIGDTARELLEDDDDLLLVRVHAYRPFPAAELAAVLSGASHVCVVDRASAFGRSARWAATSARSTSRRRRHERDLRDRRHGGDAGDAPLGAPRDAHGRAERVVEPTYVSRGGVTVAVWLDEVVTEDRLLLPGHAACAGCAPAINVRHVLGALAAAKPGVEDGAGHPGVLLDDHRRDLAGERVQGRRPPDAVRLGGGGGLGDQGGAPAARARRHERRRLGR